MPSAAVVFQNQLYYANEHDEAIHVCNKTSGENDTFLRNNTSGFVQFVRKNIY